MFTEINPAVNITGQCVSVCCVLVFCVDPFAASAPLGLPACASCFFDLETLITKIVTDKTNPPPTTVEDQAWGDYTAKVINCECDYFKLLRMRMQLRLQ